MDLHIAVISDFKSLHPDIEVVDWTFSAHSWILGRQQDMPKYINSQTWRNINTRMIENFQREYDSFLKQFDGFIVAHCPMFAMVYEKYNKPILMINSCRYDLPFCQTGDYRMLTKWNECIQRLHAKKLLTIVSNNRADQEYTYLGSGVRPLLNPSLCVYTNMKYTPEQNTFLCYTGKTPDHPLITQKSQLPVPHQWADIGKFRGVIHIPYETSTMSMFEHYTAGLPMFFPTREFWKTIADLWSVRAYWTPNMPIWLKPFRTVDKWIEMSDIYHTFKGPNIHYFHSFPHLFTLLETFTYVPESREPYIEATKAEWKKILGNMFITN